MFPKLNKHWNDTDLSLSTAVGVNVLSVLFVCLISLLDNLIGTNVECVFLCSVLHGFCSWLASVSIRNTFKIIFLRNKSTFLD